MTTPEFQQPEFQQPERRPRRLLSKPALERRFAYLDTIGRRCDADSRRCITAATVAFQVLRVDPATKQPIREPVTVQSCTRHRRVFEHSPDQYRVLSATQFPPGQQLQGREARNAILRREQQEDEPE